MILYNKYFKNSRDSYGTIYNIIAKAIFERNMEVITFSNFKLYYKGVVIRTHGIEIKTDSQWNRIEYLEAIFHTYDLQ